MKNIKKLFGKIDLTWKKLIIFAIIAGVYTALMAIIPQLHYTSFNTITVSFEVWILFGILLTHRHNDHSGELSSFPNAKYMLMKKN